MPSRSLKAGSPQALRPLRHSVRMGPVPRWGLRLRERNAEPLGS